MNCVSNLNQFPRIVWSCTAAPPQIFIKKKEESSGHWKKGWIQYFSLAFECPCNCASNKELFILKMQKLCTALNESCWINHRISSLPQSFIFKKLTFVSGAFCASQTPFSGLATFGSCLPSSGFQALLHLLNNLLVPYANRCHYEYFHIHNLIYKLKISESYFSFKKG